MSKTMSNAPSIEKHYDAEERALIKSIESDDYLIGESGLTDELLSTLRAAAKKTIVDHRQKITIRVPQTDLARLKAKALREGIPYQTAINALIHKYASS